MKWQSGKSASGTPEHRLLYPPGCNLDLVYTEFWRRILDDAIARAGQLAWKTIAFQIIPKETPDASPGELQGFFWEASNRRCEQAEYVLAASEYEVLMADDEDDDEHSRALAALYLEHFRKLRARAALEPVASLFKQACASRPLIAKAAFNDGWTDLQIGQPEMGPLPEYDQKLLAGQPARMQPDPGGLFDMEWLSLMNAVGDALIRYTPEHFKTIVCTVRLEGNRLHYDIGCPQYPDEGTTDPSEQLHQAMTRLVTYKLKRGGFPGMKFTIQIQPDGAARTHAELLNM